MKTGPQRNSVVADHRAAWSGIPQVVPSSHCTSCDVCCHFPDKDSLLAPYFTAEEIVLAVDAGVPERHFSDPAGCKITLVRFHEGYRCPAFNPEQHHCSIYPVRPFDCRIYPFALMEPEIPATGHAGVLGLDTKCPYILKSEASETIERATDALMSHLGSHAVQTLLQNDPGLINPFQEDVNMLDHFPSSHSPHPAQKKVTGDRHGGD
jgi:Fe-S-cluster containining protein